MNMQTKRIGQLLLALLILLMGATPLLATAAGEYQLTRYTIDAGGQLHSGGERFRLSGTIGQVDGTNPLVAGQRTLTGGFWGQTPMPDQPSNPPEAGSQRVFLPLVSR